MTKRKMTDTLNDIMNGVSKSAFVEKPCKIVNIHSPYMVDVEYYDNYSKDYLYNVPVKHLQTQHSFIFLGLNVGDYGTIRFFDNDISYYKKGSEDTGSEIRFHNINDGLFTLGFYPATEQYIIPEGDVVIGNNTGALITINGGNINISGGNLTVNGSSVQIGSNTSIDGVTFLEHRHTNGNNGADTGSVIT